MSLRIQTTATFLLLLLALSAFAQNKLSWNIQTPPAENVKKVFIRIFDSGNRQVFGDSLALSGSRGDIPTPVIEIGAPKSGVSIFGQGNNIHLKVNSTSSGDASVKVFSLDGRLISSANQRVSPGENEIRMKPGKLPAGIYLVDYASKSERKTAKIVSGFDNSLTGGSPGNQLKNAEINDWTIEISHPKLLTKKTTVAYSPVMALNADLLSRPTVSFIPVDLLTNKYEYGGVRPLGEKTIVPNLEVRIGNRTFGKTNSTGEFSFRPDTTGNVRIDIVDPTDKYYSKWYKATLVAGKKEVLKDIKSDYVYIITQFNDGTWDLLEAMWHIMDFTNLTGENFVCPSLPDSVMENRGGVWIDPVYKDGKHDAALADLRQLIKNFHFKGVPTLFEGNESNSYIFIHYGGTGGIDGTTNWTFRKNADNLYYTVKADVYLNNIYADAGATGYIYAIAVHEVDRVYGANDVFPQMDYVMYRDPISRWWTNGYSPENTKLEQLIWDNFMNFEGHPVIYNNMKSNRALNFPGYTGPQVTLPGKPITDFEPNQSFITKGQTVQFTDKSTQNPTEWLWNFGDGNTSTLQHPVKTFNKTGIFAVSLTASNSYGSHKKTINYCVNVVDVVQKDSVSTCLYNGYNYKTVKIGNQWWLAENLRSNQYNDGTAIPKDTVEANWTGLPTGAYCWYNNDSVSYAMNGALYNWHAVNTGKLCPKGWHVPSDEEWTLFENYLIASGYNYDGTTTGNKIAKSLADPAKWVSRSGEGLIGNDGFAAFRNKSGFSALPSGILNTYNESSYNELGGVGYLTQWWSGSESFSSHAWSRYLRYDSVSLLRDNSMKGNGFCVRCLRDK